MSYNSSETPHDFHGPDSDHSLRLPSLPRRHPLIERLMTESIQDDLTHSYRKRAQFTFFCGEEPNQLGGYEGQLEVVGRCLEWFVFDCEIPEYMQTPARYWYELYGEELSEEDQIVATDCLNFILGLFEITEVKSGQGFMVEDLLRPEQFYQISEKVISEETQPGQLLLSRIFPYRGDYSLSGMAVLMNETATWEIKQFIQEGRLNPELILPNLDGVELENLYGRSVHEISDGAGLPTLERMLRRYFDEVYPDHLSYRQLQELMHDTEDPMELLAQIDEQMEFFNRHEIDLIYSLVLSTWDKIHTS